MNAFPRTDTSVLGRWWWTVDRWMLAALATLIACGAVLLLAASPPVAERIGLDGMFFVQRHLTFLPAAAATIVAISLLSPAGVRRLGLVVLAAGAALLVLTLLAGEEVNGARRWIGVLGLSLQPSEFVKPAFAVVAAWLFARYRESGSTKHLFASIALCGILVALLVAQPDLGQAVVVSAMWLALFFLAGLSLWFVGALLLTGLMALAGAYVSLPHVTRRIDTFLHPGTGDTYQVDRSLEAFANGGLFGRGPGEGQVKNHLPDAHSDFIFAVAGEEMGLLVTLLIVVLFAFIVLRGFARVLQERDLFVLLAVAGLMTQFGLQALINMGSAVQLMPAKGMTLPFISYGGSSFIAVAMGAGMVLALTRRRVGAGKAS